jgi:hypothetical protein
MDIYHSQLIDGKFQDAIKIEIEQKFENGYALLLFQLIEEFLVFASIGNQLDLYISFRTKEGNWFPTSKLSKKINSMSQGNPYITPDNKFLFYVTGEKQKENWSVKWVDIESEIKNNDVNK